MVFNDSMELSGSSEQAAHCCLLLPFSILAGNNVVLLDQLFSEGKNPTWRNFWIRNFTMPGIFLPDSKLIKLNLWHYLTGPTV